jgi:hypothetical protein
MKKFSDVLLENKNTHMEHLEDYVLNGGVNGARQAINFLRGLRDSLAGSSSSSINVTVKWDGAPAIFAGNDPRDGKFFVAKKGIFNKNPKVYKTPEEIDADTSGDLATKLKQALEYLPKLGIKGVVQGDFLFSKKDLKIKKIDGVRYVTFHPNTIMYAVPTNTPLGKRILKSKFGIVWHTTYTGKDFESMKASFGKNIASNLVSSPDVWSVDAMYNDASGSATFTADETKALTAILSNAGKLFNKIDAKTLNSISANDELLIRMKTFLNTKVREQEKITNVKKTVREMIDYFHNYYKGEESKRKTEKGKSAVQDRKKEVMKIFTSGNARSLENILTLMNLIVDAKLMIIDKLNKSKSIDTFLLTADGIRATGQEGFVAIDKGENAVKLVDRLEFSYANFNPNVIKGWQR